MIKELLDGNAGVTLFTRPRRFGKTLNQSMFRRFFEDERKPDGSKIDNGYIFDDLSISKCGEAYLRHQQQYPVINLSLKSGKQPDFEMAYKCLIDEIAEEFRRHKYVLQCDNIEEEQKQAYLAVQKGTAEPATYAKSCLLYTSRCV